MKRLILISMLVSSSVAFAIDGTSEINEIFAHLQEACNSTDHFPVGVLEDSAKVVRAKSTKKFLPLELAEQLARLPSHSSVKAVRDQFEVSFYDANHVLKNARDLARVESPALIRVSGGRSADDELREYNECVDAFFKEYKREEVWIDELGTYQSAFADR